MECLIFYVLVIIGQFIYMLTDRSTRLNTIGLTMLGVGVVGVMVSVYVKMLLLN